MCFFNDYWLPELLDRAVISKNQIWLSQTKFSDFFCALDLHLSKELRKCVIHYWCWLQGQRGRYVGLVKAY